MSHETRVSAGETEAILEEVAYRPIKMPEVVVVHGTNASGNDIFKAIKSTGIKAPYSIRTFVDKHPDVNGYNERLREFAFKASHLFIEQELYFLMTSDASTAERGQKTSSAPHDAWLFQGVTAYSTIPLRDSDQDHFAIAVQDPSMGGNE